MVTTAKSPVFSSSSHCAGRLNKLYKLEARLSFSLQRSKAFAAEFWGWFGIGVGQVEFDFISGSHVCFVFVV